MGRYDGMKPVSVVYRGQMTLCTPLRRTPSKAFKFTYHQVRAGDRIDLLADSFIGSSREWHQIADVNPERLYFGNLEPSVILRIPYV